MTEVLFILAVVLIGGRFAARIATFFRLPGLFGELVLGLALAPFVLHSPGISDAIVMMGNIGVILLMLLVGLETDISALKGIGLLAFLVAMCGALLPFGVGIVFAQWLGLSTSEALFIGVALSATSVSITAATLRELGQLQSRAGRVILMAAVIDDVLGLLLLAFVTGQEGGRPPLEAVERVGLVAVLIVISALLLKPLLGRIERHIEGFLAMAIGIGFLFAWGVDFIGGIAPITGAFIAGLLLARSVPQVPLVRDIENMASGFFATIFFVSLGFQVRLDQIDVPLLGVFLALAIVTKIVGCGLGAKLRGLPWNEAVLIGVGMVPRGEVALIVAALGLSAHVLSSGTYSLLVVMAIGTTMMTPLALRAIFALTERLSGRSAMPMLPFAPQAIGETQTEEMGA